MYKCGVASASFQSEETVRALHDDDQDRMPDQHVADAVEQVGVHQVRRLPPARTHPRMQSAHTPSPGGAVRRAGPRRPLARAASASYGLVRNCCRSTFSRQLGHVFFLPMMTQPRRHHSWNLGRPCGRRARARARGQNTSQRALDGPAARPRPDRSAAGATYTWPHSSLMVRSTAAPASP